MEEGQDDNEMSTDAKLRQKIILRSKEEGWAWESMIGFQRY